MTKILSVDHAIQHKNHSGTSTSTSMDNKEKRALLELMLLYEVTLFKKRYFDQEIYYPLKA
ncbi:hypothetical protein J32TS6_06540 [Virgibacillus pantothenticus]|uniref:hypothetical protein n=1 Tax=Virgibacillus pantothenticus TaxID=1473 RepID=UPI000AC2EB9C|nr:hypothetical protein [Virgibacillus pantothenticus]MBU8647292.1 hypothetical protein [Virgibacillus pantothenticus]MEB5456218.1 hypothetical protein [Virgibacillus pantothenticus]MEB5469058.1 hypothetical protein [Virgibacillus pantothenticus]QTY18092.1 hypothetical protein KBP50_09830 [Virgibacillus pantothenticus]GIP62099.1 hypothetical protein J32TS6_06540 [Virgibacillus pantothenticus]